ncbi:MULTISPECIES: hypothetical protein [Saccharibacillus]|uniref:hypothetical protein n=1 Tax=Saccharibacillus TaxID=456492 RepID=UPI00123B2331|nr:hypothetical protein [Saccharibacillus sp. WB 17]MWJ30791.1 hypothetical protein [Saccharibacillus sp. WB 17]
MPEQTTNLNLPIPLGNENVNRQFFLDLIQAVDKGAVSERQLTEAIGQVAIALTQDYASTDQATAISADAVRRGLETKQNTVRLADNYLAASALINAAPDAQNRSYPDGFSFFKVSSAAGGWPTSNGYVMTMRAGSGGVQLYFEMYTGNVQSEKTARIWTRSKRDANGFWQEWNRTLTEADRALLTTWSNSVADTRMTNAAPNTYAQGVTREFKQGGTLGLADFENYVYLETRRPWVDDSAGVTLQTGYGMTTGRVYTRTSESAATWSKFHREEQGLRPPNLVWNPSGMMDFVGWANNGFGSTKTDPTYGSYFAYNGATTSTYITCDSDPILVIPGSRYTVGATFVGNNSVAGAVSYGVEVSGSTGILGSITNGTMVTRESRTLTIPVGVTSVTLRLVIYLNKPAAFRAITQVSLVAGDFDAYNNDKDSALLFQSVVNGKAAVKTAVIGKGGIVSQAGSVPTHAELAAGVNSIPLVYRSTGGSQNGGAIGTGQSFVIGTLPPVNRYLSLTAMRSPGIQISLNFNSSGGEMFLYLIDAQESVVGLISTGNVMGVSAIILDRAARTVQYRKSSNADTINASVPAAFRFDIPIRIAVTNYNASAGGYWQGDYVAIGG